MSLPISTVADPLPRVLLVSSTLDEDGGVPVCVGQLAEGLAGIGVPVGITGQHAGRLGAVISGAGRRAGVTVAAVSAPWHPRGQWQAARRVRAVVEATAAAARAEGRFLVVHVHGVWVAPVLAAAAAAVDCGATLVVSPHGMLRQEALRKSPWRKRAVWEGWLRRRLVTADALHVTSPLEGEELAALLPGCRPVLVPLGIVPPADASRGRAPGSPRRAGYLGRILPIKNLDILLRAWKLARPEGWRLAIDGPGPAEMTASLNQLAVAPCRWIASASISPASIFSSFPPVPRPSPSPSGKRSPAAFRRWSRPRRRGGMWNGWPAVGAWRRPSPGSRRRSRSPRRSRRQTSR